MTSTVNPSLGQQIHEHLEAHGLEIPMYTPIPRDYSGFEDKKSAIQGMQLGIMRALGLDLTDDSLKDTPRRVANMYVDELFYGLDYSKFPMATAFKNKSAYDEMVYSKSTVFSTCEHHMLPFIGDAHIAYIPGKNVLGLSKFSRVVDFFSRRPQVQERLTAQIHAALCYILESDDVAVVIKCEHFCGKVRGVMEHSGSMITSQLSGRFRSVDSLRNEFMAVTRL